MLPSLWERMATLCSVDVHAIKLALINLNFWCPSYILSLHDLPCGRAYLISWSDDLIFKLHWLYSYEGLYDKWLHQSARIRYVYCSVVEMNDITSPQRFNDIIRQIYSGYTSLSLRENDCYSNPPINGATDPEI